MYPHIINKGGYMKTIDLTNQKFGLLTVIGVSSTRLRNILSWDCVCDCGNTKIVAGADLRAGDTISCGCKKNMGKQKDITGQKRGALTAVSSTGEKCSNGDYKWNFVCDCGNTAIMSLGNFGSKKSPCCKICGKRNAIAAHTTHGFKNNHKTYKAWCKIKERCFNPNSPDYETYGAKGITVHPFFVEDFMNFYNEIGEAPKDGIKWSVDRIDYTKGYEPGNVRWATDSQQARNKGKSRSNTSGFTGVSWDNKKYTLKDGTQKEILYAKAMWNIVDELGNGKIEMKRFAVAEFGLLPSFAMACIYREQKIKELNELGYGYSYNHGK